MEPQIELQIETTFENIAIAKLAIKTYIANATESWKAIYSDKKRFNIICKH
jgi:hypothetical protein